MANAYIVNFNEDKTISNFHIGYNMVQQLGCGYRPLGLFYSSYYGSHCGFYGNANYPSSTWGIDGHDTPITIIPSERIIPNQGCRDTDLSGAYPADFPTINYGYASGHRSYWGDKPMYGRGYCYYIAPNVDVVNGASIVPEIPLNMGKQLWSIFERYGYSDGWSNACCRDADTGMENVEICDNRSFTTYASRIAFGKWYNDKMPHYVKYADLVTVHGNFGDRWTVADPLWSYFRSPSILTSNTPTPPNVSETDAEYGNGNLVFTFNGKATYSWTKLLEIETWDKSIMFGCNNQWNTWLWFGGSRCTLYYMMRPEGLYIGATGEMGEKLEYGEAVDVRHPSACEDVWKWSFEGTNFNWNLTSAADFDGQGVRVKARVRTLD